MSYLSRVWINPMRQHSRRLLADPRAMKAAVFAGIPSQPVDERVLWRLDSDEPRRPALFVLTRSRPSFEHLVEQAGWPAAETTQVETRDYEPVLARVVDGATFAFRLTANPVQSTTRPERPSAVQQARAENGARTRGERLGHRTAASQLAWLLSRVEQWGFEIPSSTAPTDDGSPAADVRVTARQRRSFGRGGGQPVTLQVVTYEGRLRVLDAAVLRGQLVAGFGPAKAYGCGLLTLAPSRTTA